jgi:hypothetical protein
MKMTPELVAVTSPPLDIDPTEPRLVVVRSQFKKSKAYLVGLDHFNEPSNQGLSLLLSAYQHYRAHSSNDIPYISATEGGYYVHSEPRVLSAATGVYAKPSMLDGTLEDVLRKGGEQAASTYLGRHDGTSFESTEPRANDEVTAMIGQFGVAWASYFYYMRYARQYLESKATCTYEAYVESRSSYHERNQCRLDNSLESLQATHAELYPDTPFDPSEPLSDGSLRTHEYYKQLYLPFGQGKDPETLTPIQAMTLFSNRIRDQYHYDILIAWLNLGHLGTNVFDTHGPIHTVAIEPALRATPDLSIESYAGWMACTKFLGS